MALEDLTGAKYIDSLNSSNPVGSTDPVSDVDGHLQGIKNVLKQSFPNINGAVTPSPADLNVLLGVAALGVSPTEIGYLNGVTSAIQTQLDAKQALDADLTAIAALANTDGNFIVGNGSAWVAESGATARTSLGLGTLSVQSQIDETDIDWTSSEGVTQGTFWFGDYPTLGFSSGAYADLADSNGTTATFLVYVPASATVMQYRIYAYKVGSNSSTVRLYHSAHDGTAVTLSLAKAWVSGTYTLDVADESGATSITAEANNAAGTTSNLIAVHYWFR